MKHHKNLLKPQELAAFTAYLNACGLETRDGKGDFQLLQVKVCPPDWAIISRTAAGQLTTHPDLRPLITAFRQSGVKAPTAPKAEAPKRDIAFDDLRDDFAIAALGMLAHRLGSNFKDVPWDAKKVATASYELADAMLVARQAPKQARKSDGWPAEWKGNGFNGCLNEAGKALRYLASHDRPIGGQSSFNAEHLLQIADELSVTKTELLQSN